MSIQRVALIYDDRPRPETTGVYCRRALEQLVQVEHILPEQLESLPRQGFDLYLVIDDGLRYALPRDLRPSAFWAIDTHMDLDWCTEKGQSFDLVFAAQRDGAEQLRERGVASATWLALACDRELHRPHDVPKEHDVCFIGNVFPGPRQDLVRLIQQHYVRTLVDRRYFEEMAQAYSASRIVFNRSVANDVNMRVFEAVACGSLLLTNDLTENGQAEIFRDGVHLATYASAEELLDKLAYYLKHDELREKIARAGRAHAIAEHTYLHRMRSILTAAEKLSPKIEVPVQTQAGLNGKAHFVDPSYFQHARPEILERVPHSARRVLEIGCGAGRLGEALKARQQAEVVGIEVCVAAAEQARERLDQVVVGDVEEMPLEFEPESLDCVVCGDVLEHLRSPAKLLRQARSWLKPDGCLVASLPNVRHHSVIRSLLAGNFTYEPAGLLDGTHLRFFTRRSIDELFSQAGFGIARWGAVKGPGYDDWEGQGRPGQVSVGRLAISALPQAEAEEFFIYQYLVTAQPVQPTKPPAAHANERTNGHATRRSHHERRHASGKTSQRSKARGPLHFRQDFLADFEQFTLHGPSYAFVRCADGERAVLEGRVIDVARDGWSYAGDGSPLVDELLAALRYDAPDYYLGISDGCCDAESQAWYLKRLRIPLEQVTFSNIFVNWNYRRFRQRDLSRAVMVSSKGGDFTVPENLFAAPDFDLEGLVTRLVAVDRPILVAAGPLSAAIIHKYWQRATHKQIILDVGSAIDERTKGRQTRAYQTPGTRTAELVCRW